MATERELKGGVRAGWDRRGEDRFVTCKVV